MEGQASWGGESIPNSEEKRMFFRKCLVLVFVLACGASCALAQDSFLQKFEVTPFVGSKFGGKINVSENTSNPNVENILIKSSIDYGAIVDYNIWSSFAIEFLWNRQPTSLSAEELNPNTGIPSGTQFLTDTTLDTYTFGAAYTFRSDSKIRPFIAGGVGWTNFTNVDNPNGLYLGFYNRLAYNIGGGIKYYMTDHFGLRFDLRYMPTRTTPSSGEECSVYYGCYEVAQNNHANQGGANLGVIVRF
jgi:outer membrane protein W